MELNHVLVSVADLDAALGFYETKLGFECVERDADGGYARLRVPGGDGTVGLHAATADVRPPWRDGVAIYRRLRLDQSTTVSGNTPPPAKRSSRYGDRSKGEPPSSSSAASASPTAGETMNPCPENPHAA